MSDGHTWLITGAASGIGEATVRMAAARGERVIALDINEAALTALANETGAHVMRCDVSSAEDWRAVAEWLPNTPTRVHLNAGIQIAPPTAELEDYSFEAATLENYRRMMGVNVDGVVFGLQALMHQLQPGAAIVVTASLAGITPYDVDPLYAMSKHAVVGLVRSMANPLAKRDIRINAICPGGIDTAIIPDAQRTASAVFMPPSCIADEVLMLMETDITGKSWAKVTETKPAFIVRAPGDRSG